MIRFPSTMTPKALHFHRVQSRLDELGWNQTRLAESLGLTRAAVSKWFTGKAFPRPAELLNLGKILGLGFKDLVVSGQMTPEPLVAFRKRAGTVTTAEHSDRAKEMGRLLEKLVPFLDHDPFTSPVRLKKPALDYDYLQGLVTKIRLDLGFDPANPIDFGDLIGKFAEMQAVLVPVMWGKRNRHENALHIFLPGSQTTWIFLNLDSELHDFKFWMAHELGHVLSVSLLETHAIDAAEDFADGFAGTLLFPRAAAEKWIAAYHRARSPKGRVGVLLDAAKEYVISPFSVYKELEKLAGATSLAFEALDQRLLHAEISSFNAAFNTISEILFDGHKPSADHYMRKSMETFSTPVFKALGECNQRERLSESAISRMFDIPLVDAREIKSALA
jgi:transcriptional regulator with XRE-family HTH domain